MFGFLCVCVGGGGGTACDLMAAFSMASRSSGVGSSSARISSELRGSAGIPASFFRPAQSLTLVFSAFWDREPTHTRIQTHALLAHIVVITMFILHHLKRSFSSVCCKELTCEAGQWTAAALSSLIGNFEKKKSEMSSHCTFSLMLVTMFDPQRTHKT